MDNRMIWNKTWSRLSEYSTNSAGNRWAYYLIGEILKDTKLKKDDTIIDIGCGMGNKSAYLARHFDKARVIGIDFSKEGIDFASKYYSDCKNLSFVSGDACDTNWNDFGDISMISCFEVIEHIYNWKAFLRKICSTSGKFILLSTPTGRMRSYEKKIGHYRNFKKGQIEAFMKKQGWKVKKVFYAGFPFWSPITRDFFDLHSRFVKDNKDEKSELVATYNPLVHDITYIIYRYFTSNRLGDQFVGLFEK